MYQKIVKYSIFALVALLPLFWLPFSFEAFEFNKGYLLFFLVAIGLLAWLAKMLFKDKLIVFQCTRLDFAVLGFAVVMILCAVFSKDKAASVYGFYGRFWPSLVGMLSLGGLYFLLTNNVNNAATKLKEEKGGKSASVGGILNVFLISSGLVSLIAYLSIFGVWQMLADNLPLVMLGRVFNPVAGSLQGLSVFLAVVVVLVVGQTQNIFKYLLLAAALGLLAIIDFWPAWFILGSALFVFLFLAFWKRLFKENVNRLTLPVLLFVLALIFIFANPLQGLLSQTRLANLPAEVFLRQSASWRLAWDGFKANPILGSGLSNFSYAFSKYRPASFLQDNPLWYLRLDRAGNHIAEWTATTGVLGILAYLGLIGLFLVFGYQVFRRAKTGAHTGAPLLMAFIALVIAQFVYYQNTTLAFSFWLMLGLGAVASGNRVAAEKERAKTFAFKTFPEIGLVFSIIFWVFLLGFAFFAFKLAQNYRADVYYRQYLTNPFANIEKLKKAGQISSNSSVYHIVLSQAYLANFSEELQRTQPDPQTLNNMVALAVEESKKAAEISPYRVAAYETSGIIYREIRGVAQDAVDWAIKSFEKALELEPKNPVFLTELGKLYWAKQDLDKARQMFSQAISVKDDYVDGYLQMARLEESEENMEAAKVHLETAVAKNPLSVEGLFQLGRFYYNEGELDEAEEKFLAALRLFPNHSNSLYSLGLLYERQGRVEEALDKFERVLELNPGNEDVSAKIRSLKE